MLQRSKFFARSILWGIAAAIAAPIAVILPASSAQAQFSDSYNFLKAVREKDGTEVNKMLADPASRIVDTRDASSGQTALHIVVQRQDATWVGFLLQKGANPNIGDKSGNTPLMLASQLGFIDGVDWLIDKKANVDAANRGGETALILAVHGKNTAMVRALLKAGANPDKRDYLSGMSAREYAQRDGRGNNIAALIENKGKDAEPKKDLDFSGIEPAKK